MLTTNKIHKILLAMQKNYEDIQVMIDNVAQVLSCNVYIYGNILYQSHYYTVKHLETAKYIIQDYYFCVAEAVPLQAGTNHLPNNAACIKSAGIIRGIILIQKQNLTPLEKALLEMVAGIISISIK